MGLSGYETDWNRCLGRNGMSWANYFIGQIVRWPDGKARRWLLCRFVVLPDGVKALSFQICFHPSVRSSWWNLMISLWRWQPLRIPADSGSYPCPKSSQWKASQCPPSDLSPQSESRMPSLCPQPCLKSLSHLKVHGGSKGVWKAESQRRLKRQQQATTAAWICV